jgi:polyhydroxybutyrate depolymerase
MVVTLVSIVLAAVGCDAPAGGSSPSGAGAGRCSRARPLPGGTTRRQVSVDGSARSHLLHIPPAYNGVRRLPVVVTFHGLGDNAAEQLAVSGLAAVADRNGFVVVAPESRGPGWDLGTAPSRPGSDAAFVVALRHDLPSVACVDEHRFDATGFSNGAAEVFALACANIGGFAAYGAVAGAYYLPACDRGPPQPIVYFHGTADPVVPIGGEIDSGITIAPARRYMAEWAAHNGCSAATHQMVISSDVTLVTWSGCRDDADVDCYIIAGGGHSWPGAPAGDTNDSVSASQIRWDFFAQRSR